MSYNNLTTYNQNDLNFKHYPDFLKSSHLSIKTYLLNNIFNQATHNNLRTSKIYGISGLKYNVTYRGIERESRVLDWNLFPILKDLSYLVSDITGQRYNCVAIQIYPAKTGIRPHKDKEIDKNTIIAGISLGDERYLGFSRHNYPNVKTYLESGSLYLLCPPTNSRWTHEILPGNDIRISLTYRLKTNFYIIEELPKQIDLKLKDIRKNNQEFRKNNLSYLDFYSKKKNNRFYYYLVINNQKIFKKDIPVFVDLTRIRSNEA